MSCMAVNSPGFIILFILILLLYYSLPKSWRVYFLALASVLLYSLWGVFETSLLLAVAVFSWVSAGFIYRFKDRVIVCKAMLWINIAFIAGILLTFRILPAGSIVVPVGLSFFSLQGLGYVVDVYKGKSEVERNFIIYLLFISFFPTVTSGPIQRSDVLLRKFREDVVFSYDNARYGLLMIAYGLFAKNFVADRLDYVVGHAYEGYATETGFVLLIGAVTYAFQLYCDFMGYSYIALGAAKALGFDLPDNFRSPYLSTSVKEFWNRWHISLSEWLRDYIYYPLGGSRKGKVRTLINIAIVFMISGIWHGRGLTFLIWGMLHGLYRIFDEVTLKKRNLFVYSVKSDFGRMILKTLFGILTFAAVDFAWLFFRADSVQSAFIIIQRIFTECDLVRTLREGLYTFGLSKKEIMVWVLGLLVVLAIDCLHEKGISVSGWLKRQNIVLRWSFYMAFAAFMICAEIYYYGYSASTFIYAGF